MLLIDIVESMDTRAELVWEQHGKFELTGFKMGSFYIMIQIELKPIANIPVLNGKRTAEVSFWAEDPITRKIRHDAMNIFDNKQAMQVLSIVLNCLLEKMEDYDAFSFVSMKRYPDYENKCKIYSRITDRVAKSYNFFPFKREHDNATEWVVSKIQFQLTECGDWRNELLEFVRYDLGPRLKPPVMYSTLN